MLLQNLKIGFAFTGAYCVFYQVFPQLEKLMAEGADVVTIVSYQVAITNSRYGKAEDFIKRMENITGHPVIQKMNEAELYNKQQSPLDILVIAPCTGNTMSKLADGATDTPVLMMAKEMFRNNKPVLLGIATNDGLGISAKSLGALLATKNVFFAPFGQDNYVEKPNSLVSKFELLPDSILQAMNNKQIQPILVKF